MLLGRKTGSEPINQNQPIITGAEIRIYRTQDNYETQVYSFGSELGAQNFFDDLTSNGSEFSGYLQAVFF